MTQKELRKKYMQIIKTEVYPCSREMQEFSKRRCGYIVELTDGKIIRLYKPRKHVPYDFTEIKAHGQVHMRRDMQEKSISSRLRMARRKQI